MLTADSFWLALAAGIGLALTAAPLGCFMVWRRIAYFGDAMAHASLLGVALGLALRIGQTPGILLACALFALILALLQHRGHLGGDTLLALLAYGGLAAGILALDRMDPLPGGHAAGHEGHVDIHRFLLGDISAVAPAHLYWIYGVGAVCLLLLGRAWKPLLAATAHDELAAAEGLPVLRLRILFFLLIAAFVAVAMQTIGILLVTALCVFPAATARGFARGPAQMVALAALAGAVNVTLGLWAALRWQLPASPAIVAASLLLFCGSLLVPRR